MNTFETSNDLYSFQKNTNKYIDGKIEPRIHIVAKWIGWNKTILDVGCYDGKYASLFKDNNNLVYGIDASVSAVNESIKKGIQAKVANIEDVFPFQDSQFDVVHAGEVIEHLYDTEIFIRECHRVLKPGGLLIITTPNVVSLPRRILYLFGSGRFFEASNVYSAEGDGKSVGHIRFFTKKLLRDFVEARHFMMKDYTSDYLNFPMVRSEKMAKVFKTFGRNLIMSFVKV